MTISRTHIEIGAVVLLVALLSLNHAHVFGTAAASEPIEVRWLLAHEPTSVFMRSAKVFEDELSKESHGTMKLQVISLKDLGYASVVPLQEIFRLMDEKKIELSSALLVDLETQDPEIGVLTLPYLFPSYAQAEQTLNGEIGQELLDGLSKKTPTHALAFTFSGGYRVIAMQGKIIHSLRELQGLHIAVSGGPVSEEIIKNLGAIAASGETPDATETTYSRISALSSTAGITQVVETNHNFFLTAILARDTFFDQLTKEQQTALQHAATKAAEVERQDSIALAASSKADLQAEGIPIMTLSVAENQELQNRMVSIDSLFAPKFGTNRISAVRSQH